MSFNNNFLWNIWVNKMALSHGLCYIREEFWLLSISTKARFLWYLYWMIISLHIPGLFYIYFYKWYYYTSYTGMVFWFSCIQTYLWMYFHSLKIFVVIFSSLHESESETLSRVQLFGTPWNIQSMEFSRPEYWNG